MRDRRYEVSYLEIEVMEPFSQFLQIWRPGRWGSGAAVVSAPRTIGRNPCTFAARQGTAVLTSSATMAVRGCPSATARAGRAAPRLRTRAEDS